MPNAFPSSSQRSGRGAARCYSCRSIASLSAFAFLKPVGTSSGLYPEYPGRERWIDRVFYVGEDDVAQPLSVIWKDKTPWMLNGIPGILELLATSRLRGALRLLLANGVEVVP